MDEIEFVYNFMRDSAHLKEIGAAVALCGAPVAGYLVRRFFCITQVGGRTGCEECRKEYMRQKENNKCHS